jgi:hypothetical protein
MIALRNRDPTMTATRRPLSFSSLAEVMPDVECPFSGRFDEHPLLGRLSPSQWERFHCLHCAHHLSFAVPKHF